MTTIIFVIMTMTFTTQIAHHLLFTVSPEHGTVGGFDLEISGETCLRRVETRTVATVVGSAAGEFLAVWSPCGRASCRGHGTDTRGRGVRTLDFTQLQ